MVSVLDSGLRVPGSSPGRVIVLCSWARHYTLTVPLSTQEHKWVLANCQENLAKCCEGGGGRGAVICDGLASRVFIRHQRSENSLSTTQNSLAKFRSFPE